MENGPLISDLRAYLSAVNYDIDDSACVGNCEYWENVDGNYVVISATNDGRVASNILGKVLSDMGKTRQDFSLFLESRSPSIN